MPSAPPKRGQHRGVLDDLLGASELAPTEPRALTPAPAARAAAVPAPPPAATTRRLGVHLPAAIVERAHDVVYNTPGLTLSRLVVAALTAEIDRLEQQRGEPFPARHGPIRTGRPIR